MNQLEEYRDVFDGIEPFSGYVPSGFMVDFLGTLTDASFRTLWGTDPARTGGAFVRTEAPKVSGDNAEFWFEAVNWVEAARSACGRFVMLTLGACYGSQAVGACCALRLLNRMPYTLVVVEPVPENVHWARKHMRDNAIDPDRQWLLPVAVSDTRDPVYFPIGAPGYGAQNCYATNDRAARLHYVEQLLEGDVTAALTDLVRDNRTGLTMELVPGSGWFGEIKLVSAMRLDDILGPFDLVDYVEADIQQSELIVFPPCLDLLRRKVKRIHIGTHGVEAHKRLHRLFAEAGWDITFSFEPNGSFETALGSFTTNDGVLTVRNPDL